MASINADIRAGWKIGLFFVENFNFFFFWTGTENFCPKTFGFGGRHFWTKSQNFQQKADAFQGKKCLVQNSIFSQKAVLIKHFQPSVVQMLSWVKVTQTGYQTSRLHKWRTFTHILRMRIDCILLILLWYSQPRVRLHHLHWDSLSARPVSKMWPSSENPLTSSVMESLHTMHESIRVSKAFVWVFRTW